MIYNYIFALFLGVLPSTIWLAYYLAKDIHPEPKKWIFLVFLSGMAITPFAIYFEWQIINIFEYFSSVFPIFFGSFMKNMAIVFIGIAATEEFFKFAIARFAMKRNAFFDEPADAMIYMISAALGFAAIENIVIMHLYAPLIFLDPSQPIFTLAMRFAGATFLHTLSSGIIGFYYALSLTKINRTQANRNSLILKGFAIAILLHGFFNYLILILNISSIIYLSIPLFVCLIFVSKDFKILQKISPKKFNR